MPAPGLHLWLPAGISVIKDLLVLVTIDVCTYYRVLRSVATRSMFVDGIIKQVIAFLKRLQV